MKLLTVIACTLPLLACTPEPQQGSPALSEATDVRSAAADGAAMEVSRSAARPPARGPDAWFTGAVTITPLFNPKGQSQVGAALVRFEPGARTAWHRHPLGQTLIVTAGSGRVQNWDAPVQEIRPGDVVWSPPGEKHWHGAAPTTAMTHISIVEQLDGKSADWMEHVSDEQYEAS